MMQRLLLCLTLLTFSLGLDAQIPPACFPPNAPPADDCGDACIYCNFNGINSQTTGYSPGGVPQFCGSIENDQWLGFIAGCTTATFSVTPSNCTDGNGCQIALYEECGGPFLQCNVGCSGCGTTTQSITVTNMAIGTNYYLLIDGWAGDNCDFQILVDPPQCVAAPPVGASGTLQGPATICPNGHGTFCLPAVTGAGGYVWTIPADASINGEPGPGPITLDAPDGRCATIDFGPSTGPKTVCVQPANSCFTGQQRCKTVNITPLLPTQLPPETVCFEQADLYTLPWGDPINVVVGTQPYQTTIMTAQGCDSIVKKTITVKPMLLTNLPPKVICAGECLTVGNEQFCDSGNHSVTVTTYQGCDSTINFTLTVLDPIAEIIGGGTISCNNTSVTLNSAPPTFGSPIKIWRKLPGGTQVGSGSTLTVTQPGTYTLNVTVTQGGVQCIKADTIVIPGDNTAPTLMVTGGVIGCASTTATLVATTNAPPTPTWNWTGPGGFTSNVQSPVVSAQGTYNVTVTNAVNGCTAASTVTVTGNTTAPSITTTGGTLDCNTTAVTITATSSANPSTFSWAGPGGFTSPIANPSVTTAGTYNITVTNTSNGCTSTANAVVNLDNTAPNAGASASGNIGCNNPTITLNGSSTTPNVTYAWSGPGGFTSNIQNPTTGTLGDYIVTVTGANGCTATAPVTVNGSLAVPNASASGGTLTCSATQIQLNGESSTPNVTYSWTGPGGFISTVEDPFVTNPGTYNLVVTNPTNGCTSPASTNVDTNLAQPNAAATGGVIDCAAGAVTIMGTSSTGGATVQWSGPGGFTATTNNATVTQQGTYVFTVTGTNGCTNSADAIVTLDAGVPVSFATGGELNCTNNSITVTGGTSTLGATFSWTGPSGFTSTANSFLVSQPGDYILTASAANGCTSVATAFVSQDLAVPGASAQGGQVTCTTPNFQISATTPASPVTFAWSGPNGFTSAAQNPIVSDPGNYVVVITGSNGCTSTATAILDADVNTPVAVGAGGTLTCSAVAIILQGSVNIAGSTFQWTGPNGFSTIEQNPVVSVAGTYTLKVSSPNGCTDDTTVDVDEDIVAPGAVASGNTLSCTNTSVVINGNSATAGVTYSWSGPNSFTSTNPDPTVTVIGNYIVTTMGANGCTSTATATVDEDKALPDFTISGGTLTCANPSIDLGSVVNTANSTLAWSGPGGFASVLPAPPVTVNGDYKLIVTGPNGCTDEKTVTVDEDKAPPTATALGGTLTCLVTSIPLDGNTPTPNSTYEWTGPNGYTSTDSDPIIDEAGDYILVVTGPNGCTSTATAKVDLNGQFPQLSASAANVLDCNMPTSVLNSSSSVNAVTYQWSGPNNYESFDQNPVVSVSGTYNVVITDPANGCTSDQDVVVDENFLVPQNVVADGGTIDCISGSYQLQGATSSTSVTYEWSGPLGFASTQQNPTVTNDGEYTLVVKLPNGCTASDTAVVFKNTQSPIVDIATNTPTLLTCAVDSFTVVGSTTTPNTTINWTGPGGFTSSNGSIIVTVPGSYNFTVISTVNGCITTNSVTFTQNITPPAGVSATGNTITCATPPVGVPVEAFTSTNGVTYLWSGPNNFVSGLKKANAPVPGDYTVTITANINGCTSTATATVLNNTTPPANVTSIGATILCKDPNPEISASTSTPNCTFTWTGPFGFVDAGSPISTDGEGNYIVTVLNPDNGCTTKDTVVVDSDITKPVVTATVDHIITCLMPTAIVTATTVTSPVTYKWSGPNNFTSTVQSPTVTTTGTYKVTVTSTVNGCTQVAQVVVTDDGSIPVVQISGNIITCADPAAQLVASTDKVVTWTWSGPGINAGNTTIPNPSVLIGGLYSVTATADNGCTGVATYNVLTDTQSPVVSIAPPNQFTCSDTIITVSATATPAGVSFDWTTVDGNIISATTGQQIQVNTVGDYTVLVTNPNNGCTTEKSTGVTANAAVPSGIARNDHDVRCFGETNGYSTIDSVAGGTAPYLFSFNGGPFSSTTTFTNLAAGTYTIEVEDALGCHFTETLNIAEPPQIVVNLGPDTTLILGDSILIDFTNVVNIPDAQIQQMNWSGSFLGCDTCDVFWIKPLNSQALGLIVVDTNGCRAQDVVFIEVDKQRNIYVPSAFAPESDANNLFYIFGGQDVLEIEQFQIFDRWGERLHNAVDFQPNDPGSGWDGSFRDDLANPGVYVWWARIKFIDGVVKIYKGDVTLTR